MSQLAITAFLTKYNDSGSGLYRDGQSAGSITEEDHRTLITDLSDSVPFTHLDEPLTFTCDGYSVTFNDAASIAFNTTTFAVISLDAIGLSAISDIEIISSGGDVELSADGDIIIDNLAGSGDRMVVVDNAGVISHAAIPEAGTSASYTPTHYLALNIASSTVFDLYYDRNGDNMRVFGRIDATPSASGDSQIDISIPLASAFTAVGDVGGSGTLSRSSTYRAVFIQADPVNDRVTIQFSAIDNGNHIISFEFSYLIK